MTYLDRSLYLGTHGKKRVWLDADDQILSMHLVGLPGKGKSKFMESMIRQDIKNGRGLCLIDPHGKLVEDLLAWLPTQPLLFKELLASGRLTVLEPASLTWGFPFNPFGKPFSNGQSRDYYAGSLVKVMTQIWGREVYEQPTIRNNLFALFYVLLEKGLTLAHSRYFLDQHDTNGIRARLTKEIENPIVGDRWRELNSLSATRYHEQFIGPANRLHGFLSSSILFRIFSQQEHLDFRRAMDEGRIILVNMAPQSRFSSMDGDVLAGLIINEIYQEALLRTTNKPRPFGLYIDECHRYITDDIAKILSEGRKFGVSVVLAHQYLGQLREKSVELFEGIMQAAQTKVVFGLADIEDCKRLASNLFTFDPMAVKQYGFEVQGQRKEWMNNRSINEASNTTSGVSKTKGTARSRTVGKQELETHSTMESSTEGRSEGVSDATVVGQVESWGESSSEVMNADGDLVVSSVNDSSSGGVSSSSSHGRSSASSWAVSSAHGHAISKGKSMAAARAKSFQVARSKTVGKSSGRSEGAAETYVPIYIQVPKIYHSIDEQVYSAAQTIKNLVAQYAFIRLPGQPQALKLKIARVAPPLNPKTNKPIPGHWIPQIAEVISRRSPDVYLLEEGEHAPDNPVQFEEEEPDFHIFDDRDGDGE